MRGFSLTPTAIRDLQEIWSYIADDDVRAADRLETELLKACGFLASQPGFGTARPLWTSFDVKFWVVKGHYFIVFTPDTEPLEILRIIHGARDIPGLLGENGLDD